MTHFAMAFAAVVQMLWEGNVPFAAELFCPGMLQETTSSDSRLWEVRGRERRTKAGEAE